MTLKKKPVTGMKDILPEDYAAIIDSPNEKPLS